MDHWWRWQKPPIRSRKKSWSPIPVWRCFGYAHNIRVTLWGARQVSYCSIHEGLQSNNLCLRTNCIRQNFFHGGAWSCCWIVNEECLGYPRTSSSSFWNYSQIHFYHLHQHQWGSWKGSLILIKMLISWSIQWNYSRHSFNASWHEP